MSGAGWVMPAKTRYSNRIDGETRIKMGYAMESSDMDTEGVSGNVITEQNRFSPQNHAQNAHKSSAFQDEEQRNIPGRFVAAITNTPLRSSVPSISVSI